MAINDPEYFAKGGTTSGQVRWEPYLEKSIVGYLENNSVMRQFCYIYRLNGTYSANIPKSFTTGNAIEVVEGTEIPAVRQVLSTVDVKVVENGTAIQLSDESKKLDWYGDLLAREMEEAMKRMLRKENTDIMTTFEAGASTSTQTLTSGKLAFDDIYDARTYLRGEHYNPDTVFVHPNQYGDLVKSEDFRQYYQSNSTAPLREGTVGGTVAGLNIVEIPELTPGTTLVADMSAKPLWLVVLQDLEAEAFRLPDRRMDKVQMTIYEKPAILKPEAIRKITLKA